MKRTFGKILSLLLAVTLVFGTVAFGFADVDWSEIDWHDFAIKAEASNENKESYYTYTYYVDLFTKDAEITKVDKSINGDVVIPETLGGYDVTHIYAGAFYNCDKITSVCIPKEVYLIDDGYFSENDKEYPIDRLYGAFSDCNNIERITVDEDNNHFSNDEYGVLYEGATGIIQYPIGSKNKEYFISDKIKKISTGSFYNCANLEYIKVDENNSMYSSDEYGVLFNKDKTELIQYPAGNTRTEYTVPSTVKSIGFGAFAHCNNLRFINISESVTDIGHRAFEGCTNLSEISLPDSVTGIRNGAFCNTGYFNDSANWQDGILYISNHLIAAKNDISGVCEVRNGTKTIADAAFYNCDGLTGVVIPDSVEIIGHMSFYNCDNLKSIKISDNVLEIGIGAFLESGYYYTESNWENKKLYIDNHFIAIKEDFSGQCNIKGGTKTIAGGAFMGVDTLTWVVIPDSVVSIGDCAFAGCYSLLLKNTIAENIKSIGFCAFTGCKNLSDIIIPDGVTSIKTGTFSGCEGLRNITIPHSVISIGDYAFYECGYNLRSITIPEDVVRVGDYAFADCYSLSNIIIPNSVTSIGVAAFGNCENVKSVIIGDGVTIIGDGAFGGCDNLTSVTIGSGVRFVGKEIFNCCYNLTDVYYTGNIAEWCEIRYTNLYDVPMYYAKNLYIDGVLIEGDLILPDNLARIGDFSFAFCKNLTNITFGENVTSVGVGAFCRCNNLKSAVFSDKVTVVGDGAFAICPNLEEVTIGNGVTCLGYCTFAWCDSLKNVTIPNSVTNIGDNAFYDCDSLASITIPNSVTGIGDYAFYDCDSLTSITIPDSVTSIGFSSFKYCTHLANVTIGNSVSSIGEGAFNGCIGLTGITVDSENTAYSSDEYGVLFNKDKTEIIQYPIGNTRTSYVIPDSVTSIAVGAFESSDTLTDVYFDGTEDEWHKVKISNYNKALTDAKIHFKFSNADEPETELTTNSIATETTTKPVVTVPSTTKPVEIPVTTKPVTTKPAEEPSTTNPNIENTTDSVVTKPSTEPTKPVESPTAKPATTKPVTTKPVEIPTTTRPVVTKPATEPTKPVETPSATTTKPVTDESTTKPVTAEPSTVPATQPSTEQKKLFEIRKPSQTEIKYGDSIILHADFESKIPEGAKVIWSTDNANFKIVETTSSGETCIVTPNANGNTVFTATLVDAYGNAIASDTQTMTAKAGFFQKIIAFFKKIFGLTKVIPEMLK